MLKVIGLLLLIVGMFGVFAEEENTSPLNGTERKVFESLSKKKPPKDKMTPYNEKKKNSKELNDKLNKLNGEIDSLQNTDIKLLDGDIEFFKAKIKRQETNREKIIDSISEARNTVNQFNQAVMDYVSEQQNKNGYIVIGVPAFVRGKEYKNFSGASRLLVVNMNYPANSSYQAVGGEIVTLGMGKVQFVVLHRHEDGSCSIELAGNDFEITDEDKDIDNSFFRKSFLFTKNYAKLKKGDLWGVIIDANAGLTYDEFATGSSYVTAYNGEETIKWSDDNVQSKNTFSFSLFVQAIDKE